MKHFPFVHQLESMDCGLTCLQMVALYYGKEINGEMIRRQFSVGKNGMSMLRLYEVAEVMGFYAMGVNTSFERLCKMPLPCIVHWRQIHYVVVYSIVGYAGEKGICIRVADPSDGLVNYTVEEFMKGWTNALWRNKKGIALLLEPKF